MDGTLRDLRQGFRMILRTPLLSLVAILTIGLGVGSTTFVFSVVYGTLLRGPDVRDEDRLVILAQTRPAEGDDQLSVPWSDYVDFADGQTSFEQLEAYYSGTVNLAGDEGPPERFQGGFVTPGTLSMLGVPPVVGRTFVEEEGLPGAAPVVVLGWDAWRIRFAGDESVVGRTVRVNGETAQIVGVMPEGFGFPFDQDLWLALRRGREVEERRSGTFLQVAGYLRPGVSVEAATEEVASIARRMETDYPELNEGIGARVLSYTDGYMPDQIRRMMLLMMAMVVGVLLVAGANVANVLLARAAVREREVAIRSAMGAGRWRVVRQLLSEAVALGVGGAIVGLGIAWIGIDLFTTAVGDVGKPYWIVWRLDAPALLFTSLMALLAAVVAGTLPALRASGGDISTILRDDSRGSSSLRVGRLASGLVVAELAVSCGLMIAAGLMVRSLVELNQVDLGFESAGMMTARVGLFESDYPEPEDRNRFFHEVLDRIEGEPSVSAASFSSGLPGTGAGGWRIQVDGQSYETDADIPQAGRTAVSEGFFEAFGIPIVEGRTFRRAESEWGGEPVAIVNRSFADRFLGGSALDRRIRVGGVDTEEPWLRVVGVVEDVYAGTGAFGGGGQRDEAVYVALGAADANFMSLATRTRGDPAAAAETLRRTVSGVDPNLPLYWVRTLDEALSGTTFMHRIFGSIFAIFGVAALFLAAVGLYGVIDFSVSNRVREIGVRVALGADRRAVLRLILGRVVGQLAVGGAIGVALGLALAVPLSTTLFGVERFDALVYAIIVGTLGLTGLAAALVPTRRALAVDPVVAFRA